MSQEVSEPLKKANVVGLGLIGASVALALQDLGFFVSGYDNDPDVAKTALDRNIISQIEIASDVVISFICTPVATAVEQVNQALETTSGIVTDVGSVKSHVAVAIQNHRFVSGHPMAGSELDGIDGADASMFDKAVWVLCPNESTSDETFAVVAELLTSFGAEVVALNPKTHDEVVAIVSHVPHLTAVTLMRLADNHSEEHLALLRLAAGGFRDMTRIASGRPGIWLDICDQNRDAIVHGLNSLIDGLGLMRDVVSGGRREELMTILSQARAARTNLPASVGPTDKLSEIRIPIPDRPGAAAEVFTLSGELNVNIFDFEVVHSLHGDKGVMVTVVRAEQAEIFRSGLLLRGFKPAVQSLS